MWTKPKILLLGLACLAYVYWAMKFDRPLGAYGLYVTGRALLLGFLLVVAAIVGFIRRK